jgi:CLIP-associating protein 1/2
VSQGPRTIPLLLDRLGDQKERHRLLAAQCLGDVWKASPQEVEKAIRDIALASKNPRTKENSMHWIAKVCLFDRS